MTIHRIITTLLVAASLLAVTPTYAQNAQAKKPSREQLAQIQAQKIANELHLDEITAKKFTATFTSCKNEMWANAPQKPSKNIEDMTEEEARGILTQRFTHRKKLDAIQEKYYEEYSKILTQRQLLKMYELEKKMMDRMYRQHNGRKSATKNRQKEKSAKTN